MHLKIETITPKQAKVYLDTNHQSQRNVKQTKVNLFADMMTNGQFNGENGEALKFAKNGKGDVLIDGQHRLLGIVESGKSIKIAVIRGLSMESFKTVDQGDNRTVENFYQIAGIPHAKLCSQVGKWLYYNEHGVSPLKWQTIPYGPLPIPGVVAEWSMKVNDDLPECIDRVSDYLCQFQRKGLGTKNHLAYCYYLWQKKDRELAYEVTKYLGSGEGSVPLTIVSLREWLMAEAVKDKQEALPGTIRGTKVINGMVTGWNAIRSGKKNIKRFARMVTEFEKKIMKTAGDSRHIRVATAK